MDQNMIVLRGGSFDGTRESLNELSATVFGIEKTPLLDPDEPLMNGAIWNDRAFVGAHLIKHGYDRTGETELIDNLVHTVYRFNNTITEENVIFREDN